MKLSKAQNIIAVVFLVLMVFNAIGGMTLHNVVDTYSIFLSIYGVHLSIILTYYFVQEPIENKTVPKIRFILLLLLLLIWNGIIAGLTVSSYETVADLQANLDEFPHYADFLIAGGIVWLFNGKTDS